MTEVDWGRLRPFRTSKEDAFEELVCHLAEEEQPSGCVSFVRKGTPDAGIECFWTMEDGSEIGWQAKFHRDSLDDSRWQNVGDSFQTAFEKHPNLVKYIICLPRNLSDSRNNTTEQDRYDAFVSKWTNYATERNRKVEIELWNETAIVKRLSKPQNRGIVWFWFGTPALTSDWFDAQVTNATTNANAQGRYDKSLHVENSETIFFDSVCRNVKFWARIEEHFTELTSEATYFKRAISDFEKHKEHALFTQSLNNLNTTLCELLAESDDIASERLIADLPLTEIDTKLSDLDTSLSSLFAAISTELTIRDSESAGDGYHKKSEQHRNFEYRHWKLSQAIQSFTFLINSTSIQSSNALGLLLMGDAGQGKTHTFCNWTAKSNDQNNPAILLFGENFDDRSPWIQIIEQVGLNCDVDEFVGGLATRFVPVGTYS